MNVLPKIVVLTSRFPFPTEKGDKLRLYHQLLHLKKDFEIHLIALSESSTSQSSIQTIQDLGIHTYVLDFKPKNYVQLGWKAFWTRSPLQLEYFYRKKTHTAIDKLLDEIQPVIVYCQLVRMVPYLINYKGLKVIDIMDAMSLNMANEGRVRPFPINQVYQRESILLKQKEREIIHDFDHSFIISQRDLEYLDVQPTLLSKVSIVENGVDLEYYTVNLDQKPEFQIGFIGNMGYSPNVNAVKYIAEEVLPKLPEAYKFLISGARPTIEVQNLQNDQITVSGWVDDIRQSYYDCKIIVAAIFTGAGQQNKILEAMACGIPCVATHQVNQSIGAINQESILIANTPDEFADQIQLLVNNKVLYSKIRQNARKFVELNFKWNVQVQKLTTVLNKKINDNIGSRNKAQHHT